MTTDSPPTAEQALTLEIVDALAVIAPRGWQRVELFLARGSRGDVRVSELRSHLAGTEPLPKPQLGLEPGSLHGVVNEALRDLLTLFGRIEALPAMVSVEKRGEHEYALTIPKADPHRERVIEIDGAHGDLLLFTDVLFDALLTVERDFEPKQKTLSEEIAGHDDWEYDANALSLQLKRGVLPWRKLHAVPVGSFVYESEHWLWAWANRSLPDEARAPTGAMHEAVLQLPGFMALRRPDLPCNEAFAIRLAALAAMRLDARGLYGAPFGTGVMMLAVMRDGA